MSPSLLSILARSPYARRPQLVARCVKRRLGLATPFRFDQGATLASWQHSPRLAEALRAWVTAAAPTADVPPETRLFGQDFEAALLEELGRTGPRARPDLNGDVKLIWEYSRSPSLILGALCAPASARSQVAAEGASFLQRWLAHHPDPAGPAWSNAMEVALRAVVWICTDAVLEGGLQRAFGEANWRRQMAHHQRAIKAGLEAHLVSSNHYLANLLGLYFIQQHAGLPAARRTGRELEAAFAAQSHPDGGAYEASLPYHALITEMGLLYTALAGPAAGPRWAARLARMAQIMADFSEPGLDVFPVGDDDSGRVIPLDAITPRRSRAECLLALAGQVLGRPFTRHAEAWCPDSGWWVARTSDFTAFLEFGGVGFLGRGAHAHNDDLSVLCWWKNLPVFVDPGSYLYSADPAARNSFRSTTSHNVLSLADTEQRPLPQGGGGALFHLPGRAAAWPVLDRASQAITVQALLGAGTWTRTVRVSGRGVQVLDRCAGQEGRPVRARFLLHPDWHPEPAAGGIHLHHAQGGKLVFRPSSGVALRIEGGWISPRYGFKMATRQLVADMAADRAQDVEWLLES
jgi:hypothetical protein